LQVDAAAADYPWRAEVAADRTKQRLERTECGVVGGLDVLAVFLASRERSAILVSPGLVPATSCGTVCASEEPNAEEYASSNGGSARGV
jgi:hypothetical protein